MSGISEAQTLLVTSPSSSVIKPSTSISRLTGYKRPCHGEMQEAPGLKKVHLLSSHAEEFSSAAAPVYPESVAG